MSTTTWIKLNLPIGTPISSPSSLSDISSTDFIPSSCLPENEGNLKASLLITDANLQLSPTPPDIPVALSSHRHQSTVLSTLSSTTHHVHQLTPSALSTISPRIASNPDQAVLPEVEHWSSVQVPRVRSRGSSISSMGPSVHAHTSCRSTLLEEFRRQAECERLCNQLGNHLWNPDRHSYGYSDDNAHNHSHTTGLPARTLPPSDLPSSSSSSLHVLTHRSSLVRVPPVNSSLGPLRPVSPPSTWGRQQHLIDIDGNPYSGAMFRRAPRPSSLTSTADQSPSGRPRSKLRKSHRPFLVLTPPGSFDSTNAFTTPTPASILPDSKVIDLTDLTSTISHINSTTPSGRVTINQQHESMASRPNRRPLNVTYPSHSTDGSCTSGSSTTTSAHTSSFSASTAPTSPSLMSEHHKSYPPLHSSLSDPLRVSSSRNLDEHPLPPLPAEVHQNATRILPNTAGRPNSQLSPKHNPSRKLTKRRAPSGSFNAILDRPLPPTPITADTADSEPKSDHPPTRRSRSILGIRIPMGTESSKKRSMRDHAEPRPHSLPFEPHGPLWTGTKSLSHPYARPAPESSSTTIYTPALLSATTSPNSPPTSLPYASHITHKRSHSDALADLAFTGATTLSSSALAHLTSRLSLRDQSPEKNGSGVYSSNPNDQHTVFDPYAQQSQHQQQQQYITESPTDDQRASEDGYTVGCAAALDVSSVFRRRSGKAGPKAIGSRRAKSLHVSASATFIHAERHHTPPPPLPQTTGLKRSSQAPVSFFDSWYGGEDAVATTTTMRRWTLALTDVSDEVLVQELEKIRKEGREMERERKKCIIANGGAMNSAAQGGDGTQPRGRRTSRVGSPPSSTSFVYGGPSIIDPVAPRSQRTAKFHIGGDGPQSAEGCESDDDIPDGTEEFLDDDPSTEDEEAGWKTARRALLCCRELVRTERTYQTHLRQLLQGDVQFDPQSSSLPPLILTHLPALLFASEVFLSRLEDDPSAWGVSAALLACEEDIERAFVSWCEVVGDLFVNSDPSSSVSSEEKATSHSPRKLVRKSTVSTSESSGESKSRVGSTFGGRGRARSVASVVSSSNSHESAYRPRATSYYGSLSASPPPAPVPTSYYVIRGHPYNPAGPSGMFTAALGTGLAYGISPPSPPDPVTDSGSSRTISPGQFGTTPTSAIGHPFAFGSTSGLGRTFTAWRRRSFVSPSSSLPSGLPGLHLSLTGLSSSGTSGHGHGNGNNGSRERKPTVRELAIQPTQRVMRYVLQYRDLLDHTPTTSPSRALVERALESALRIAEKCDRAQNNDAFAQR